MGYDIYVIKNKINNKLYVGKTTIGVDKRFKQHLKNAKYKVNRYLYDAINKYGFDNFICEFLDDAENKAKANEKETWYIFLLKSHMSLGCGYNMTWGGDGGATITGKSMKGKTFFDKWVKLYGEDVAIKMKNDHYKKIGQLISEATKGRTISESQRKKQSETNKKLGIKPPKTYWGEGNGPFKDKHHKEPALKKLSIARKGKKYEEVFKDIDNVKKVKDNKSNNWLKEKNPLSILNPNSKYYQPNLIELAEKIKKMIDNKIYLKDIIVELNITANNCRRYFFEIYGIELKDYKKLNNL